MKSQVAHNDVGRSAFALIMVLMLVAAASVLGMCCLWSSSIRLAGSQNFVTAARARMLAESGVQHAMYTLRTDAEALLAAGADNPLGPYHLDSMNDSYWFYCLGQGGGSTFSIASHSACGGLNADVRVTARLQSNYRSLLESAGPTHYWRLGESSGTTCRDSVGSANGSFVNGVMLCAAGAIVGDNDTATTYNGNNQYVSIPSINPFGSAMTMMAWVRGDNVDLYDRWVLSKISGGSVNRVYWALGVLGASGSNRLACRVKTSNKTTTLQASVALAKQEWVFVAAVYTGQHIILYQNGVEVARIAETGSIQTSSASTTIGSTTHQPTGNPWSGGIDEVAMFFKALSASQIAALYNARAPDVDIVRWDD